MNCPICYKNQKKLIWNKPIRSGKNTWTKKPRKIYHCNNCDLRFRGEFEIRLINNKIFRKIFDGSNSIQMYHSFNKSREKLKLDKITKIVNFENKSILESNCGAATNLDYLKKKTTQTVGLDDEIYRKHVEKKHLFFSSFSTLKKSKIKFDIILSLAEIEHQYNIQNFLKNLKFILKKNGIIIFRIPNFNNIYMHFLGDKFFTYDYRTSHNFYFSEESIDFLFKQQKFKTIYKTGLQEYSINHFIKFLKTKKRVKSFEQFFNKKSSSEFENNLEKFKVSTSLLYVIKKK